MKDLLYNFVSLNVKFPLTRKQDKNHILKAMKKRFLFTEKVKTTCRVPKKEVTNLGSVLWQKFSHFSNSNACTLHHFLNNFRPPKLGESLNA